MMDGSNFGAYRTLYYYYKVWKRQDIFNITPIVFGSHIRRKSYTPRMALG